jgi:hypothetical protein
MSRRSALKYRFVTYAIKYISSIAFPIAIAKTYGSIVNGDVQLLIAGTSYLGLLDSGMTINALNRGGTRGDSPQKRAENTLRYQLNSSKQILFIGFCIASTLLLFAGWNHVISVDLLFAGSLLAAVAILEIAVTPFKYYLYSHGLAATVEKREAWMSTLSTAALLTWSLLILAGFLPLVVGLPIGLILLRSDRVASGLTSLGDLLSIANSSDDKITLRQAVQVPVVNRNIHGNEGQDRLWISALQILALLNWSADMFLIKFIVGSSAVSDYSIYSKFFMIPVAIATLASPVIQSAVSQGKLKPDGFALMANCSWPCIIFITIAFAAILNQIFAMFSLLPGSLGLTSNPSVYLLVGFCCLSMLSVVSGFYAPIANGLRLFKYQVIVSAIFLPSNILLSLFMGSSLRLGMLGVIGATCFTMAITSCFMVPKKIFKRLRYINDTQNYAKSSSSC